MSEIACLRKKNIQTDRIITEILVMFVIETIESVAGIDSFNWFTADMTCKLFARVGHVKMRQQHFERKDSEFKTAILICRGVAKVGITSMQWRHYENYIENS